MKITLLVLLIGLNCQAETTIRDTLRIEQGCRLALVKYTNYTLDKILDECAELIDIYNGKLPTKREVKK